MSLTHFSSYLINIKIKYLNFAVLQLTCVRRLLQRMTSFSAKSTPKKPQPMMKSGNGYVMCCGASKASSRMSRTCQ